MTKILAWSTVGTMILFVIIVAVLLISGYRPPADRGTARMMAWLIASPLILSIMLAVALLVRSTLKSES